LCLIRIDWQVECPALHVATERLRPTNRLLTMIEAVPNAEFVWRLKDLGFYAPFAAVEKFRPKEFVVRVELEQQLAWRSLRRWFDRPESDAHRAILTDAVTTEVT
jgi:hypothetical protein